MSQSKSKIPSPARSQGAPTTPRQHRKPRSLSVASPARSDASGRLTNVVEQYLKNDKFAVSPMRRRSVLPDDTDIEMPRRASWWKRLEGSSRDVLEALDTNQMQGDLLEEYEFEVPQEKQTVQTLPENSDNDSVASIVVPHRRLFNQKKQPQEKFAEIAGSRKSLGKTLLDDQDQTINELPKNLFSKGQPRNRPVFPAALLNSTNKTINKTVEPEPNKQGRNLFGQAGTKRKNMFTDFVLSDSEDDSLVQHKVFGFKKDNKRISLASRNRRMPSLTPSVTTDIDIDDWNLLPSSTMIGNGSGAMEESRIIADEEIEEAQAEDQDLTLTEANESLEPEAGRLNTSNKSRKSKSLNRTRLSKSRKLDNDFDKTLTNENIEEAQSNKNTQNEDNAEFQEIDNNRPHNKTVISETQKDKSMEIETSKQESSGKDQILQQDLNNIDINEQTTVNEPSIEEKMADLHKESEDKSEQEIEPSVEQESEKEISHGDQEEEVEEPESSKEMSNNQNEDTNEPEISKEITKDDQDDTKEAESSKEISNDNQDEEIDDQDDTKEAESSKEISNDNQDEEIDDQDDTKEEESSKEISNDNGDDEMEPMVWSDNDAEKASVSNNKNDAQGDEETGENDDKEEDDQNNDNKQEISNHATPFKEIPNKSQKIVESSAEEDEGEEQEKIEQENNFVDKTPNSSYNTTGRNRKKLETDVNSPETVLKNTSKDDISFKPIGRSTSFRKSKSVIEDINVRATLIPIQESTIGSEGSRNSSTEGSGWDSHRTTRQTLRQTFGKDFTPRKSLRALVMEQSAKRQMGDINNSKANKTKNKTVEDVTDHHIRDRRVSKRNLSTDQMPAPKSPVPDISTHHETEPLISKPQVSYHKSHHDINEHLISRQTISNEKSVNSNRATIDSGPEISIDASYGQGMSRETFENEKDYTVDKTKHHEKSRHNITAKKDTVPMETDQVMQEELDYDPSIQDSIHDVSMAEISEHEKSEKENSGQHEVTIQELSDHDEEEREDSEQEIEAQESEQEEEEEQELDNEESQENIEPESEEELEHEESQQIEVESEQDEDLEMSQQEIEIPSEEEQQQESEQDVELDSERESEDEQSEQNESQESSVNDISHQQSDEESDRDVSDVPQIQIDSDNEQNDQTSEKLTERIVFDNEMSDQEIQYEVSDRISRQITEDEVTEHDVSDMESDREISVSRFSEQAKDLDESIGTKKSLLLMQMQRIAQENMEIKMKIREQVKNSLKPTSTTNKFMPMQSTFPVRRIAKPEPKKLKNQPRQTTLAFGTLPKEFVEDLKYKPPKRYQPATAPWITKRLYKFLETKLEPKYDYRARVRAEELVQTIHSFAKLVRRRDLAPQNAVDELKTEMARLNVVKTHFEFYEFFHDFMPREVRVKVNPDVVNRIPVPRNGIFGDILQSRTDAA